MMTRERFGEILDELACELPAAFYEKLERGICVLSRVKFHTAAPGLCVMGEYERDPVMGRQIVIYYGSFLRVLGNAPEDEWRTEMRRVLRHEFRHHMEGLAGQRDLEIEDERQISEYVRNVRGEDAP